MRSGIIRLLTHRAGTNPDSMAILSPGRSTLTRAGTRAPLNPAYKAEEFDFYLSDLNATAIVLQTGADSPAGTTAEARGIPVIELSAAPRDSLEARTHD